MSSQSKTRLFCLTTAMALSCAVLPQNAHAALAITNGDFEADAATQTNNVTDWFDTIGSSTAGTWFTVTWAGTTVSPTGSSVLGLSFEGEVTNWAYQSLGVNDGGDTSLDLTFDLGSFTDADTFASGGRDMGLQLSVYSVDGTYAGGADDVDINGATGATLLDSATVTTGVLMGGDLLLGQTASLDISGTTGQQLFLRLENVPGSTYTVGDQNGGPWLAVDNLHLPLAFTGYAWDNEAADGSYSNATNWDTDTLPPANADILFGNVITANTTVTVDTGSNVQLNSLNFDAANVADYYLAADSTEHLVLSGTNGTNGEAVITVNAGRDWLQLPVEDSAGQGIEKTGTGELILDSANGFTGDLTVSAGRLSILNASALPSGSGLNIAAGANVVVSGGDVFFADNGMVSTGVKGATIDNVISGDGDLILGGGADVTLTGANTLTGPISLLEQSSLTVSGSGTLGDTTGATNISGQSTVTLDTNVGNENFFINDESQLVLNGTTLGTAPGGALLNLDENADGEPAKIVANGNTTINDNIYGSIDDDGGHYEINAAAGATLTLNGTISGYDAVDPGDRTFVFSGDGNINAGVVTDALTDAAGDIAAVSTETNVNVVKRGAGTMTIGNGTTAINNFWQGTTTVEGGTLAVNVGGSNDGELRSSTIDVRAGATFDTSAFTSYSTQVTVDPDGIQFNGDEVGQTVSGAGTIYTGAGTLAVFDAAVIAPGDSGAGTLSVNGNMSFSQLVPNPNGYSDYELSATAAGTNDLLDVSNTLTLSASGGGTFDFTFKPIDNILQAGTPYTLMQAGNLAGSVSAANFTGQIVKADGSPMTTRLTPSFSVNSGSSGNVQVTFTGSPMNLAWSGSVNSNWDVNSTANFNTGAQTYYDMDSVTFGSAGGGGSVAVAESVMPNAVTVSDTAYDFSGSDINAQSVTVNNGGTASFANTVNSNVSVANTGTLAGAGTINGNVDVQAGGSLRIGGDGLLNVAALSITNGDFEADTAQTSNVTDWYDTVTANTANWWESTWAGPTVSPNGTSVLGLSFMFEETNWAYQSLGSNDDAKTSLDLQFDLGSFTDAGADREMSLTLSVYAVDGTFAGGADNTDIDGATGATLVDTVTLTPFTIAPGAVLADQTASLDISGTTGQQLFLRLENVTGSTYVSGSTTGGPWLAVDNLVILGSGSGSAFAGETMTVDGDVTLDASASLSFDIAGDGINDLLSLTGALTAGGTLDVNLQAGVTGLSDGYTYDLFDFASASGTFATINLPTLDSGLEWDTSNLLVTGEIAVVANPAIPGDLNGDGYVGLDDLQPILDHWNQNVTVGDPMMGDISGPGGVPDGYVGLDDLQPVLDHWNEGVPPTPSSIPEPASLALLSLGGLALMRRR